MTKAELLEWINGCYHFAWQLSQIDALERYYHPDFTGQFNQQVSFDLHSLRQRIIECSVALKARYSTVTMSKRLDNQLHINSCLSACLRYAHNEQRIWYSKSKLYLQDSKIIHCEIDADATFAEHPLL